MSGQRYAILLQDSRRRLTIQPLMMDAVFWEFSEDTAKSVEPGQTAREILKLIPRFVAKAEELTSPYEFGVYDLLVLPESFPYGGQLLCSSSVSQLMCQGMENSCLTFVTPTLVAGDRSEVDVAAHEISHVS